MVTLNTKMKVYQACVLSTLLYGSEAWTLYKHQERRRNAFHMRNLRRLLGITWQDRVSNADDLARAGMLSMFATLRDACAGSDTYAGWRMAASQRTFSMESLPPEHGQPVDPLWATSMSARGI